MTLIAYRETLTLEVRGQRLDMLIPATNQEAQAFKQKHVFRPAWEYEAIMAALLERFLGVLDVPQFLDIGAFIGYYSLLSGRLLEGRPGRVVAIESNPKHVAVMQEAVQLNRLTNVQVVHAALSDREEDLHSQLEMVSSEKLDKVSNDQEENDGTLVRGVTGDALCRRLGVTPNIVKIDVHGFEGRTLAGMREMLHGPIRYVFLELHPPYYLTRVAPGTSRMQILESLESFGFHLYYVAGHRHPLTEGVRGFLDTGRVPYQQLTPENRRWLLFDRYHAIFILASKEPLESLVGPSLDPET